MGIHQMKTHRYMAATIKMSHFANKKIFLMSHKCNRLSSGTSSAICSWWSLIACHNVRVLKTLKSGSKFTHKSFIGSAPVCFSYL